LFPTQVKNCLGKN